MSNKITLLIFCVITFFVESKSQNSTKWMDYVDLSKNGIIYNRSNDQHTLTGSKIFITLKHDDPYVFGLSNKYNLRHFEVYKKSTNKVILITSDTKERVLKKEYDEIEQLGLNTYKVKLGNNWGVIDTLENIIIPFKYYRIESADPGFQYDISNDPNLYENNIKPLEVQLFLTMEVVNGNNFNYYYIDRKGNLILDDKTSENFEINYFVKNHQLFSIYTKKSKKEIQLSYDIKNHHYTPPLYRKYYKTAICKLGEIPKLFFEGRYSQQERDDDFIHAAPWYFNNRSIFFKSNNALIDIIYLNQFDDVTTYNNLKAIFNFENLNFIKEVPPFYSIKILNKNLFQINKFKSYALISNDFKLIKPFSELGFYEFTNLFAGQDESLKKYAVDSNLFNSIIHPNTQIESDSLLLFGKQDKKGVGIYKLHLGVVVPAIYTSIKRCTKRYCITLFKDNSYNILDLYTYKNILKNNFDNIVYQVAYNGSNYDHHYFECILDGKVQKVILNE